MKKRIGLIILGIAILIGMVVYFTRDTSPVSHYVSEEGKERFMKAYDTAMSQLPKPDTTLDIKTSYGTARVYYFGSGHTTDKEPLLLLPGRSASTPMWKPNLEGLLKAKPIYTIDLIGEPGMSTQTKAIVSDEDQANWLDEVVRQLPEKKLHLVGVSIGGWTATNYAVRHPEKLASLTVLDPVFTFDSIPIPTILVSIPASIPAIPTPIRNWMLSYISGGAKVSKDDPIANLIETGMHTYAVKSPTPSLLTNEQLHKIDIPVLALMAGKSVMNDPETAVSNAKRDLRQGEVELFQDASHAINGEYAEEVNARIIDFVK